MKENNTKILPIVIWSAQTTLVILVDGIYSSVDIYWNPGSMLDCCSGS